MFSKTAILLFLLLIPFGVAAQTTKEGVLQETLELIEAGDLDALETYIAQMQEQFERGEVSADHVRQMFMPFGRADLEIARFAEEWQAERPNSPYAQLAVTWSLHRFSWQLRGNRYVSATYPEAIATFQDMQRHAWQLAANAYKAQPRLIPASDAIIRLANGSRQRPYAIEVFEKVMETDPNSGSLERALSMFLPGWGDRYAQVAKICDAHAAQYWDAPAESALSCKIENAYERFSEQREWIDERLARGDLPHLNRYRLGSLLVNDATRAQAQLAYDILSDPDYTDFRSASFFDAILGQKHGFPIVQDAHWARERAKAQQDLAESPYYPEALFKLMEPELSFSTDENGRLLTKVVSRPALETVLEYSERLLVSDPFNPESWKSYVVAMSRSFPEASYFAMDPYRINAIITSNHSVNELNIHLQEKVGIFDVYERLQTGSLPKELAKAFEGSSLEHDILCPFIRAYRVRQAICDARTQNGCELAQEVAATFTVMENEVKRRGICAKERNLPAQSLAYRTITYPEIEYSN